LKEGGHVIKNNILTNVETRNIVKRDYDFLGVAGENNIEQLVFKLTAFIDGEAILEIEKYNPENELEKYFIALDKKDESYVLEVKSSLLDVAKDIKMQLHITTENEEVFISKTFIMHVYEQIKATETVPEQYAEWIDIANAKIAQMNSLKHTLETAEQERQDAEILRNQAVADAIANIEDLTEQYNENAIEKTEEFNSNVVEKANEFNTNASNKTDDFNDNADDRKQELEDIAEAIEDMSTAWQFATFEVDDDMHLNIIQAERLKNTNFIFDENTGRLGVRIYNG
jgi:hypothetical protein